MRSSAYVISGPVHHPFMATVMPPSIVVAQNVIAYSTQFAAAIATRSPLPTPYCSRERARDRGRGRRASRAYVTVRSGNTT